MNNVTNDRFSADTLSSIKDLFYEYEELLLEKRVLAGIAPDESISVSLDIETYHDEASNASKLKCIIGIELTEDIDDPDDDTIEEISDTVNDYLCGRGDLENRLSALGVELEDIDWWPVEFSMIDE